MFRAEWTGTRPAGDGTHTFSPPKAGHPHWHFDAVSSLVAKTREGRNGSVPISAVENAELFDTYETDSINHFLNPASIASTSQVVRRGGSQNLHTRILLRIHQSWNHGRMDARRT